MTGIYCASMPKRLEAMAKGTAEAMGCHVSMAVDTSEPAAINDYESIRLAAHNAVETLYGDCFASMKQKMGSEDFAVIMEKCLPFFVSSATITKKKELFIRSIPKISV